MYIFILIALILVVSAISLLGYFKEFRKKYPEFFNFIFTLVATFVGVLMAVSISNYNEQQKEKENVIKRLDAANIEVTKKIADNKKLVTSLEMMKALYKDNEIDGMEDVFVSMVDVKLPVQFENLTYDPVVLRNISSRGVGEFPTSWESLVLSKKTISDNNEFITAGGGYMFIDLFNIQLKYVQSIITLESDRLKGKLPKGGVKTAYENARKENQEENYNLTTKKTKKITELAFSSLKKEAADSGAILPENLFDELIDSSTFKFQELLEEKKAEALQIQDSLTDKSDEEAIEKQLKKMMDKLGQ